MVNTYSNFSIEDLQILGLTKEIDRRKKQIEYVCEFNNKNRYAYNNILEKEIGIAIDFIYEKSNDFEDFVENIIHFTITERICMEIRENEDRNEFIHISIKDNMCKDYKNGLCLCRSLTKLIL